MFQCYVDHLKEVNKLEQEAEELREKAEEMNEIVAYFTVHGEADDDEIQSIHEESSSLHEDAKQKVLHHILLKILLLLYTRMKNI